MVTQRRLKASVTDIEEGIFDTHVAYSIIALANLITHNTMKNTLAGTGLSVNEWRVMRMASIYGTVCAADIIDLFGLDKTTTSRAVSRLHKRKLVKLSVDRKDKRQTNVALSASGKKLHDRTVRRDNISDAYIEKILSPRELQSFHKSMRKLRRHVKQLLQESS